MLHITHRALQRCVTAITASCGSLFDFAFVELTLIYRLDRSRYVTCDPHMPAGGREESPWISATASSGMFTYGSHFRGQAQRAPSRPSGHTPGRIALHYRCLHNTVCRFYITPRQSARRWCDVDRQVAPRATRRMSVQRLSPGKRGIIDSVYKYLTFAASRA